MAYALQYDYAIELYLDGLSFWPEAMEEGHIPLREVSLRRNADGGKKSGFGDGSKYKKASGKSPKDAMLKAEYLLSKDPVNLGHMKDIVQAAYELDFQQTANWMADILLDGNMRAKKPDYNIYIFLRDIYEKLHGFSRAVQACRLALQIKPNNGDLQNSLRNLSAQSTLKEGKYDDESDFTSSIKGKEDQEKIRKQDVISKSEDFLVEAIKEARAEYMATPSASECIDRFVKALCDTDTDSDENEAIGVLMKVFGETEQFSYKQRANEIKIKQARRNLLSLQKQLKPDPHNEDIRQQVGQASRGVLDAELAHYDECVINFPSDRRLKFEYGKCLLRDKKFDQAIPLFQEARSDPKHRISAVNYIGQSFYHKKWYTDAIESFQQAFDMLDNKESGLAKELLYNLGRAHEANDNPEEALSSYRRVAQIDFNFRDARQRVDQLRSKQ